MGTQKLKKWLTNWHTYDKPTDDGKYRSWVFTWHTDEVFDFNTWKYIKYLIVGEERCPSTGRRHYQGYVTWTNQRTFKVMKSLNKKISWRVAKGNAEQNFNYCTKEQFYQEIGEKPKQGKRTDLEELRDRVFNNEKLIDIVKDTKNYQELRFVECLSKYVNNVETREDLKVIWLWGETGTGKTHLAKEWAKENNLDCWTSQDTLQWWEGYTGQDVILIDDFRANYCTFGSLLRYLDKYPIRVMNKGGSANLTSKVIFITSAFHPGKVYNIREDIGQLYRRLTHIAYFDYNKEPEWKTRPEGNYNIREWIEVVAKTQNSEVGGNTKTPTSEVEFPDMKVQQHYDPIKALNDEM